MSPNQIFINLFSFLCFMLSENEGKIAIKFVREIIDAEVKQIPRDEQTLSDIFQFNRGVFVTIHTYPHYELRGCIGIPYPIMPLKKALIEAGKSAINDPRFNPLSEPELDSVIVEVTILTEPKLIEVDDPSKYPLHVTIGEDGLIINLHGRSGLLLPQVPVEQGWDADDFLTHLCLKAGLSPDAWFNPDVKIYKFSGQIFSECSPHGEIKEK